MRKALIILAVCAVMICAFAVTGAASARDAGQSNVRQYDMKNYNRDTGQLVKYGTLTVKVLPDGTGTYVVNSNPQLLGGNLHTYWKEHYPGNSYRLWGVTPNGARYWFSSATQTVGNGGTEHGTGTLSIGDVKWLEMWGDDAHTVISS